jgi:hypothetical protein
MFPNGETDIKSSTNELLRIVKNKCKVAKRFKLANKRTNAK